MKVFLLFAVLISTAFSKKLTPEEDEQRAKTCGRVKKPAHDLPQYHAPWVATYLNGGPSSWFKGSFLISDYHMITNSEITMRSKHILISHGNYRDDHNVWEWYMQGEGTVNINDCKDGVIKIPESQNQTIVNCRNPEGGRLMCVNDTMYGDGFVKKFDGADTLLGLSFGKEDEKALYTPHIGVSLPYYKDKICEITGVCKDTIIEKPTEAPKTSDAPGTSDESSSSNVFGIMELLILIVLVYLK
ncbi:hypothetical protein CAEBREN_01251 [Caenorhabditis brenneri]|uniref:Uncharacterized protein n=1 Tax=Caenorhabditis brenneri TaxID=135651 RepID=G0MD77_CAEBE|nr:hypothetical protein CAEBREN_01251 [Caenorhabditis brenneri]